MSDRERVPIRPPEEPILSSPYEEPPAHWMYDTQTGEAQRIPGRRPASYWLKSERVMSGQMALFAEEEREDIPLINNLRADVKRWRNAGYEGATEVTKKLLNYWRREDRPRRFFYCQLEAAETIIFLNEIRLSEKYLRFKPQVTGEDLANLKDEPLNVDFDEPLTRMGIKMATGSGKTVVMAMLAAWAFCNRGQVSSDERFPNALLVVCPNLTIKERLQVLRPDHAGNYYEEFDVVPQQMRPLLQSGKVKVTNWHLFLPESPHAEGGETYQVVDKGPEGPESFARRVLGDLHDRASQGGLMVFNDEAHHAWRPHPMTLEHVDSPDVDRDELSEATVWVEGLDKLNEAVGLPFVVDLSATPFYIQGSGYVEGSPFPWLVSDFGLVDAIESGIVKIPRIPAADNIGHPDPKYYKLWEHVTDKLAPGEKLPNGKPKPAVAYRKAEGALQTLAAQWVERFHVIQEATDDQDRTPPVLIIVCDNTDIAEHFYEQISGERQEEQVVVDGKGNEKVETVTVYGSGSVFPQYFSNMPHAPRRTVRIDSKLLDKAESVTEGMSREEAAEHLRRIVATVGKPGEPGEHVRCVVSVAMLNEGWDANNVTHILGLRAFGSQLLCEQVVGRGLRRMDYVPDPETGKLTEEYVDVYGVPFTLIPFKGREPGEPATTVDRPKNHVRALPEREEYEIRFPVVEGYVFALKKNAITADVDAMEPLTLEPGKEPVAVFVMPQVGDHVGPPTLSGPGQFEKQDRELFYKENHLQTIEFEIARQIVTALAEGRGDPRMRYQSRHQLFPQVLGLVHVYVQNKVDIKGLDPRELGLKAYVDRIVGRFLDAIRPAEEAGEAPLMPTLNRYQPLGSTADVDYKTTRICHSTPHSHLNQMALDTKTWEQSAGFWLEAAAAEGHVDYYARNDGLAFTIPYEYQKIQHAYEPDFLVRLRGGDDPGEHETLILEIKGLETDQDRAKHEAAKRWCAAVNNWGKLGRWRFHVCRDPQTLPQELKALTSNP